MRDRLSGGQRLRIDNLAPRFFRDLTKEVAPFDGVGTGQRFLRRRTRLHDRDVRLGDLAPLELAGEFSRGTWRRRHEHHARHRPVEPVRHSQVAGSISAEPVPKPLLHRLNPRRRLRCQADRLEDRDHTGAFAKDDWRFHGGLAAPRRESMHSLDRHLTRWIRTKAEHRFAALFCLLVSKVTNGVLHAPIP